MIFLKLCGSIIGFYVAIRLAGVGIAWAREFIENLKPPRRE